jgi:hypothetical protein
MRFSFSNGPSASACVDQGSAEIDGTIESGDGLRLVAGAVAGAHAHGPEPDRYPQALAYEFDGLRRVF